MKIDIEQMVKNKTIEAKKYLKDPDAGYYINGYRYGLVDALKALGLYE